MADRADVNFESCKYPRNVYNTSFQKKHWNEQLHAILKIVTPVRIRGYVRDNTIEFLHTAVKHKSKDVQATPAAIHSSKELCQKYSADELEDFYEQLEPIIKQWQNVKKQEDENIRLILVASTLPKKQQGKISTTEAKKSETPQKLKKTSRSCISDKL